MRSISTKLIVWTGLIIVIFSTMLLYRTYRLTMENVTDLARQQLTLGLSFDLGIRSYFADEVRSLMFRLVGENEFYPETMSTSAAAREIFLRVRKTFPDYIIKFSAENPRNPANQAGPDELHMIDWFNGHPDENTWYGELTIDGRQYFCVFGAMRMEKSCLHCHGDPTDAPTGLIRLYGSSTGFNLPLGKVVGLDTIAIPYNTFTSRVRVKTMQNFFIIGVGILLLVISLLVVYKTLIIDRLRRMSVHITTARTVSQVAALPPLRIRGTDEISVLAETFNKFTRWVNATRSSLEETVSDRTMALQSTNELLQREIVERKRIQDELQQSHAILEERVLERTSALSESNRELEEKIEALRTAEHHIRRSVSEKTVLLQEVHHRVKNNLQMIISLINLQGHHSKGKSTESFIRESTMFIKSIARIHQKLYENEDFVSVNMADYLRESLRDIIDIFTFSPGRISLDLRIDEVMLDIDKAISCGLLLNELMLNSLKHAFPEDVSGTISISLKQNTNHEPVELVYEDDGRGFTDQTADGFGSMLITNLAHQLDMAVERLDRPGGGTRYIFLRMDVDEMDNSVSTPHKTR